MGEVTLDEEIDELIKLLKEIDNSINVVRKIKVLVKDCIEERATSV